MNRFERTLIEKMADILGPAWIVEMDHRMVYVRHTNGSAITSWVDGDGRTNASDADARDVLERAHSRLRGEIPKYTPHFQQRAREALHDWPQAC